MSSSQDGPPVNDNLVAAQDEPTPHRVQPAAEKPSSTSHDQTQQSSQQSQHQRQQQQHQHVHPTLPLREVCKDIHNRVSRFLSTPAADDTTRGTQEQTRVAVSVIEDALQRYTFDSLSLSYNGGKDCLVLLVLYLSVIHTHFTQPSGRRKQGEDEDGGRGQPDIDADAGNTSSSLPAPSSSSPSTRSNFPSTIPSIYAKPPDPFDAVTTFVDASTRAYHLDLVHISTNPGSHPKEKSHSSPPARVEVADPVHHAVTTTTTTTTAMTNGDLPSTNNTATPIVSFRDAFAMYLQDQPKIQAIFVGTRRTDPHGATLQHFQMTDGNWPRFMRIHPVIDWKLSEIWCFLRSEHLADPRTGQMLEYCSMYDAGYTSLGGVGDTLRNPKLMYMDENGQERYRPAYQMTADHAERAGRE